MQRYQKLIPNCLVLVRIHQPPENLPLKVPKSSQKRSSLQNHPPSSATTPDLNPDHSQAAAHNDTFVKLYEYDIGNYVENIRSLSDAEKHDLRWIPPDLAS